MEQIIVSRFIEFNSPYVSWGEHNIGLEDIQDGINRKVPIIDEIFATGQGFIKDFKTKDWHIGRILYFVFNPHKIDSISVDNHCMNGHVLPYPVILDGHHRFLATVFLKWTHMYIEYGGREDVLNYLKGNTDELPYE